MTGSEGIRPGESGKQVTGGVRHTGHPLGLPA
jgi:hypothetical protein